MERPTKKRITRMHRIRVEMSRMTITGSGGGLVGKNSGL